MRKEGHLEKLLGYVGANLRARRVARGLTQDQLAESADLDLRFLQRVERGQTNVSLAVLVALTDALGMKVTALFRPAKLPEARRGRPPKAHAKPKRGR